MTLRCHRILITLTISFKYKPGSGSDRFSPEFWGDPASSAPNKRYGERMETFELTGWSLQNPPNK
eukprot:scaffold1147_cov126-Cylindrotheca_fusiformis.AAC.10